MPIHGWTITNTFYFENHARFWCCLNIISEVINETVELMVLSGVDMKSVAQTITNKVKSTSLLQFEYVLWLNRTVGYQMGISISLHVKSFL